MTKDEFVYEALRRGYRQEPEDMLGALYDVSTGLPEDHPYQKLMEDLRTGKSPKEEHADISCADHPYLVTEEILKAAGGMLEAMDKPASAVRAGQMIEEYNEPWMQERARMELEELPLWRAYEKLDRSMLDEAGRIAADMKENGNAAGVKDSAEYEAMTEAVEKFAASKPGAVYGSAMGQILAENMKAAGCAIEKYIESEKQDMKNPNVAMSLRVLQMADPERAGRIDTLLRDRNASRSRISLDELQGENGKKQISTRNRRHTPEKQEPQYTRR